MGREMTETNFMHVLSFVPTWEAIDAIIAGESRSRKDPVNFGANMLG